MVLAVSYFASPSTSDEKKSSSGGGSKSKKSKSSGTEGSSNSINNSSSNTTTTTTTSNNNKKTTDSVVDIDGAEGSDLRGYKKLNDGRKTSYFHRELSEQEKQIIGDCSPRPISAGSQPTDFAPRQIQVDSNASSSSSAWNAAGTFEEKNIIEWSKSTLSEILKSLEVRTESSEASPIVVSVTKVNSVSGESVVTFSRGKKKYIYDLTAELTWQLRCGSISLEGTCYLSDVTADETCELQFSLTRGASGGDKQSQTLFDNYIRGAKSKFPVNLKKRIEQACVEFMQVMKSKY